MNRPSDSCLLLSGMLILAGTAFVLACHIDTSTSCGTAKQTTRCDRNLPQYASAMGYLLDESRSIIGALCYAKAEEYFHGGIRPTRPVAFNDSWFQLWNGRIHPSAHHHLTGRAVNELMPWFWLSLQVDPHNTGTYLATAFLLSTEGHRFDLAHRVLREAQANNPFDPAIQLERAKLFLKQRRIEAARNALDAGLAFWPGRAAATSNDAMLLKADLLMYRGLLHEAYQELPGAIAAYRDILGMFPQRKVISDRLALLLSDRAPSVLAPDYWSAILEQDRQKRLHDTCGRKDDNHDHDKE